MEEIVKNIIASYNSLWKVKIHGSTIEIVTPIATTNNIFVSVFLTRRGNEYIVTDGAWIDSGMYETEIGFEDTYYQKLFNYYMDDYQIKATNTHGYIYYYKKITDLRLIADVVYDLSNFISVVVSSSFIPFEERKEREQIGRFKRNANNYLSQFVDEKSLKKNYSIHDGLVIKFNAVLIRKNKLTLFSYVTGTNDTNFILSLGRANLNYDTVDSHPINKFVENKITLIDDTVKSFSSPKIVPYMGTFKAKQGRTF